MTEHPIVTLSRRYPQLFLPIQNGMKDSELYRSVVLRGEDVERNLDFSMCEKDTLSTISTPAGIAEVLYIENREDFEHAMKSLAYKCEDREIPASIGATTVMGLINWEKLRPHTQDDEDFKNFISDKTNYLDSIILLSKGPYSAVKGSEIGIDDDQWIEKSRIVRQYHELTHFVSRKMFIENKNTIRDEVLADAMGIVSAFDNYNKDYARAFLGIKGDTYIPGGRLENYQTETSIEQNVKYSNYLIEKFYQHLIKMPKYHIFDMLLEIEGETIGL